MAKNIRKQSQANLEYANAQGWSFSDDDTLGLKSIIDDIYYEQKFEPRTIRTVETGKINLYLFDCNYYGPPDPRDAQHGTACLIQSEAFKQVGAPVLLRKKTWMEEKFLSDQVDMGDTPFAREFIVLSKNPVAAQQTINGPVQSILLEHAKKPLFNPVEIAIGSGGAVFLTGRTYEHDRLHDLLDLARQIESAFDY